MEQYQKDVSIVIPAYNRDEVLINCLKSLLISAKKADKANMILEIIVSTFKPSKKLKQMFEELDKYGLMKENRFSKWNISAARNAGINASSGQVVILLDADMIVGDQYVVEHYQAHKNANVLCAGAVNNYQNSVNGLIGEPKSFTLLAPTVGECVDDIRAIIPLDSLPAPWALAWSGNVSFNSSIVSERFDTQMSGWGGEDIDWARRASREVDKVIFKQNLATWHQYHSRKRSNEIIDERNNFNKMFHKYLDVETEFVTCFGDIRGNLILRDIILFTRKTSCFCVSRKGDIGRIGGRFAECEEIYQLVGIRTPWDDGELSCIIVESWLMELPPPVPKRIMDEAYRVARFVEVH